MQIKIFKFFGFTIQLEKAWEEYDEVGDALRKFTRYPCKANIIAVLDELNDCTNVMEGIAKVEYGVNMDEIKANKKHKLVRTSVIIDKIDKNLSYKDKIKEYDRLRKEV